MDSWRGGNGRKRGLD
uniref:Uncharacterized protein n=1 Tax=Arundo donax TaxID=35708 RepID=A0A0A9E8Q8_ARUDO